MGNTTATTRLIVFRLLLKSLSLSVGTGYWYRPRPTRVLLRLPPTLKTMNSENTVETYDILLTISEIFWGVSLEAAPLIPHKIFEGTAVSRCPSKSPLRPATRVIGPQAVSIII